MELPVSVFCFLFLGAFEVEGFSWSSKGLWIFRILSLSQFTIVDGSVLLLISFSSDLALLESVHSFEVFRLIKNFDICELCGCELVVL